MPKLTDVRLRWAPLLLGAVVLVLMGSTAAAQAEPCTRLHTLVSEQSLWLCETAPPATAVEADTPTHTAVETDAPEPASTPAPRPEACTLLHTFAAGQTLWLCEPAPPATAAETDTPAPSSTPTLTAVDTDTPAPAFTPTLTAVDTDTPVPSATPTRTAMGTDTPVPSPTPTFTASLTPLPSLTPTPRPTPLPTATHPGDSSVFLEDGPVLFLNDALIQSRTGTIRVVPTPVRTRAEPVIGSEQHSPVYRNRNFTAGVVRDAETGLFMLWYHQAHPETLLPHNVRVLSQDGIDWGPPEPLLGLQGTPLQQVWDEGPAYRPASERYQAVVSAPGLPPRWFGELWTSPDGLSWSPAPLNPVTTRAYGELWTLFRKADTGQRLLLHRFNQTGYTWTDQQGITRTNTLHDTFVRTFALAQEGADGDFLPSTTVFKPDALDAGETQFYHMSNILWRGGYYIGMLAVLRDDLVAPDTPPTVYHPGYDAHLEVYGTGWTALAYSRDGLTWTRLRHSTPFLSPAPHPAAWDHAVAWVTSMVPVGQELYLYYGGYQYGHKVYSDRSIGLLVTKRDRLHGIRGAGATPLRIQTRLVRFAATTLALNADADGGQVRIRFVAGGGPLPGFNFADCTVVTGDVAGAPVTCKGGIGTLAHRSVRIEVELTNADLYALYLDDAEVLP